MASRLFKRSIRPRLAWLLTAVIVLSIGWWGVTLFTQSRPIVIATGHESGQYHQFGLAFQDALLNQSGRAVNVRTTHGSIENRDLLRSGEADLAILQEQLASSARDTANSLLSSTRASAPGNLRLRPERSVLLALYTMSIQRTNASIAGLEKATLAWAMPMKLQPQPSSVFAIASSPGVTTSATSIPDASAERTRSYTAPWWNAPKLISPSISVSPTKSTMKATMPSTPARRAWRA